MYLRIILQFFASYAHLSRIVIIVIVNEVIDRRIPEDEEGTWGVETWGHVVRIRQKRCSESV